MSRRSSTSLIKYLSKSWSMPLVMKKTKRQIRKKTKVINRFEILYQLFRENNQDTLKFNLLFEKYKSLSVKEQKMTLNKINRSLIIIEKQKNSNFDLELYLNQYVSHSLY